jgi:hypothetical protein
VAGSWSSLFESDRTLFRRSFLKKFSDLNFALHILVLRSVNLSVIELDFDRSLKGKENSIKIQLSSEIRLISSVSKLRNPVYIPHRLGPCGSHRSGSTLEVPNVCHDKPVSGSYAVIPVPRTKKPMSIPPRSRLGSNEGNVYWYAINAHLGKREELIAHTI